MPKAKSIACLLLAGMLTPSFALDVQAPVDARPSLGAPRTLPDIHARLLDAGFNPAAVATPELLQAAQRSILPSSVVRQGVRPLAIRSVKPLQKAVAVQPAGFMQKLGQLFDGSSQNGIAGFMTRIRGAAEASPQSPILYKEDMDGGSIEIRREQLDKPFLFSATLENGTGENGVLSNEVGDTFLAQFQIEDGKVKLVRLNSFFEADKNSAEYRALKSSFPDSILATVPILRSDAKSVSIPARDFLFSDFTNVGGQVAAAYRSADLKLAGGTIESAASYARNAEMKVRMDFAGSEVGSAVLPDGRYISLGVHYSFTALPESSSFVPRPADQRVGYFTVAHLDYSDRDLADRSVPLTRKITRWNVEKKDPSAAVSDAKNPIVYWIDSTVPERFRPAVRSGLLAWNAAFEAIGIRNAIIVKDAEKDMTAEEKASYDPADIAYNVVHWFMATSSGFAEGPHRHNPLTGEIFNGKIRIGDAMSRLTVFEELLGLGASGHPLAQKMAQEDRDGALALQAAQALAVIGADSSLSAQDKEAAFEKLVEGYLTSVIIHEMGHELGLRHNMEASSTIPNAELGKDGILTSSVMDYLPINIAVPGQPQGPYFQTKLGAYDMAAIRYAYAPLPAEPLARQTALSQIADEFSKDPRLAYGTDEDTGGANPDVQTFTLGSDAVAFARDRVAISQELMKKLASATPSRAEGYEALLRTFSAALSMLVNGEQAVIPVVGGIRSHRVLPGDAKPAFEPVSIEEQRAALKFLDEQIFRLKLDIPPAVLARMAPDRVNTEFKAIKPVSLSDLTAKLQQAALDGLFNGARLQRLAKSASLVSDPSKALSIPELMDTVRKAVWSELDDPQLTDIPEARRNLQIAYAKSIAGVSMEPTGLLAALMEAFGVEPAPAEARYAAAQAKQQIKDAIGKALQRKDKLTPITVQHLQKMQSQLL